MNASNCRFTAQQRATLEAGHPIDISHGQCLTGTDNVVVLWGVAAVVGVLVYKLLGR